MAQMEGGNECEGDSSQDTETGSVTSKQGMSSTTEAAVGGKGAGSYAVSGAGSRKSRRKQSDPRRLGTEVVHIKMEVDIKSEPSDDDDDVSGDAVGDHVHDFGDEEDDVFTRTGLPSISDSELLGSAGFSKQSTSHARSLLKLNRGHDCNVESPEELTSGIGRGAHKVEVEDVPDSQPEPEDLSIGKRKRERVDNRVLLAIPSVIRPPRPEAETEPTEREPRDYHDLVDGLNALSGQNSARHFRTPPSEVYLERESGLVELEKDYRLKYRQLVYNDEFHHEAKSHDHTRVAHGPSFALSRDHKLALDPDDCNSSSPDIHYGQKDGKVSPSTSTSSSSSTSPSSKDTKKTHPQRTYKNLSRSRRIVANARERNRVHTISAAFEGLRRAVPSYSHNQKLSKLAILRIACSYILALAKLADLDYSSDEQKQMSFEECVNLCTETLQAEGRSKRRKGPME